MMLVKPIYELILWNNCNRNCYFCWQKQQNDDLKHSQMLDSIHKTIEFVKQIKDNSHVLLVGGELFDKKNSQIVNKLKYIFDLVQQ